MRTFRESNYKKKLFAKNSNDPAQSNPQLTCSNLKILENRAIELSDPKSLAHTRKNLPRPCEIVQQAKDI